MQSSSDEIKEAFRIAKATPIPTFEERIELLNAFYEVASKKKDHLAKVISKETGKPLWDSLSEVASMIQKVPISIQAFDDRCKDKMTGHAFWKYKPHGTAVVFGPFNFPMHLPNGHIIPAFLAGNKIIFKPSEYTSTCGLEYIKLFEESGFPKGLIQIVLGGKEVGQTLISDDRLDALFFTGSVPTGLFLSEYFAKKTGKLLALEMGGNNPLVIATIKDLQTAVYQTLVSAYLTTGQRCTCARRLIVIDNDPFIKKLQEAIPSIKIGNYDENPFMGPLISENAVLNVLKSQEALIKLGGKPLVFSKQLQGAFITPGLIDVTDVKQLPDVEIFGPFLQVIRVKNLDEAIQKANDTQYGLISSIFTDSDEEYQKFYAESKTGLINRNTATTGALSTNPFGGTGLSGNHRPSAYFAADYCSVVIAGIEAKELQKPKTLFPGIPYG